MVTKDALIKLGYDEKIIDRFIKRKSLIRDDNDKLVIESDTLLNSIFKKALQFDIELAKELFPYVTIENQFFYLIIVGKIDEAAVLSGYVKSDSNLFKIINYLLFCANINEEDIKINNIHSDDLSEYYELLYKYIYFREPDMINTILDKMNEVEIFDFNLFMIKKSCDILPVKSEYFYDFSEYKQTNAARNILTSMERELLINLELENYNEVVRILEELILIHDNKECFIIIKLLLNELKRISKYKRLVSDRDYNILIGPTFFVLLDLIKSRDYYRFDEVVSKLLDEMEEFSFVLEVYKILIDRILYINNRNLNLITKEIKSMCNGTDDDIKLFGKYNLTSIPADVISGCESFNEEIDMSVDYYGIYLEEYNRGDYKSALSSLKKYKIFLRKNNDPRKIDYLIQELEILIYNSNALLSNKNLEKEYMNKAYECIAQDFYEKAIEYIEHALKFQKKANPYTKSLIGCLYYELEDYESCVNLFKSIKGYILKPNDYIYYIKGLYRLGSYEEAIELADNYFDTYGIDDGILYYIKMCAYLKLKKYNDALESLTDLENYNAIYNNNFGQYTYEREMIKSIRDGKDLEIDIDEYYDFGIAKGEKELFIKIKNNEITQEYVNKLIDDSKSIDDLENRLEYLLTVIKSLFILEEGFLALDVMKYLKNSINTEEIEDKDRIIRILSVYNNNFLTID